jgi:hypothetical protein
MMSLRSTLPSLCLGAVLLLGLTRPHASQASAATKSPYAEVEVCFALDTTGSMSGLIEAAKQKIWSIANALAQAPSKPKLRFCLMAFRDRGDAYVTRHHVLTDDIDQVYAQLMDFKAAGGGDTPEAINQALLETVQRSGWNPSPEVLKIIFLVGDAPASVYADEPQYPEIVARAKAAGILINPVVCGNSRDTLAEFEQIAALGGGRSAQIVQAGRVDNTPTPMDQDLSALNQRLGRLLIPYGSAEQQEALLEKQRRAEAMSDSGLSERLAFNRATGRIVQGRGDLIEALDSGEVELAKLDRAALPEALRSMEEAELAAHVQAIREQRQSLQLVLDPLILLRKQHLEERARAGDDFDTTVREILSAQLQGG